MQRVWSPALWSVGRSLRPTTATARIIQDLIIRARRLRITAIRRLHPRRRPAILHRRLGIFRRHPTMARRLALPLGTQRYRSYNPQTGTYLGNDGQRHHCP